ncbi:MAG: AzlD domain-containing protein [Actinomycetota bacterium]|nr:AzlD domain-containing protein [Actinomycetota bacterium]
MSATTTFWLIIAVLAVGTWAMRALPIMLHGHVALPSWAERLLRYVPVAALTALVVPGALYVKVDGAYTFAAARLLAAGVAMLVAARTKSVVWTLAAGMVTLWIGQALLGG